MVFHVRWILLTTSLRIPPESVATRVGFGDEWWEKSISHGKSFKMHFLAYFTLQGTLVMQNTLGKVEDPEKHVRWISLTTVLYMGESQKCARKTIPCVLMLIMYETEFWLKYVLFNKNCVYHSYIGTNFIMGWPKPVMLVTKLLWNEMQDICMHVMLIQADGMKWSDDFIGRKLETVYFRHNGPISHPVVKSVVKCMVITRLSKWFGIELYCVSTNRVSDLAAIEWLRSQRLTTGFLVVMGGDQTHNKRSRKYRGM